MKEESRFFDRLIDARHKLTHATKDNKEVNHCPCGTCVNFNLYNYALFCKRSNKLLLGRFYRNRLKHCP